MIFVKAKCFYDYRLPISLVILAIGLMRLKMSKKLSGKF
jgi:hypothetical protein